MQIRLLFEDFITVNVYFRICRAAVGFDSEHCGNEYKIKMYKSSSIFQLAWAITSVSAGKNWGTDGGTCRARHQPSHQEQLRVLMQVFQKRA